MPTPASVPGTGAVSDRAALEAQLKMLTTVRDRLYALLRDGAQRRGDARGQAHA